MAKRGVAAALGLSLASTTTYSAERNRDLRIVIDTIPHARQRYPTVGDWQIDKASNLHITI